MSYVIDIRPHPDKEPGNKIIHVNGNAWGQIKTRSLGPRGAAYEFYDCDGCSIRVPSYHSVTRGQQYMVALVYSDKIERRNLKPGHDLIPLGKRLEQKARTLIADGYLKSPEDVRAEQTEREAAYERRQREIEAEKDAAFGAKADECLKPITENGIWTIPEMRERIIEALKWAQSQ